jgi:large subunit ribosomal protein L35
MPKMKTVKAISAKFKVTASGKLKRHRPGRRHLLTKKTSKRKHHLERPAYVNASQEAMYKRLMGVN